MECLPAGAAGCGRAETKAPGGTPPRTGNPPAAHSAAVVSGTARNDGAAAVPVYETGRTTLTMNSPSRMLVKMIVPLLKYG